jgi:cellulose synthase/poly-beta-1,6-N-acetylglucosamine synthase-like glycosyltransferase
VIIPTYHDWERLELCLKAMSLQTYPSERIEVLVVNNDPADPPPTNLVLTNVKIIDELSPGSYAARNKGLASCSGDILAFTDSDCIPDSRWIQNAVDLLLAGAERIAGKIELFYRSERLSPAEIYEKKFAFPQQRYANRGFAATANLVTWKTCFAKVGAFNADLMSGGDYEWGNRASELGLSVVYASSVVVRHPARDSLKSLLQKRRRVLGGAHSISIVPRTSLAGLLLRGFLPPLRGVCRSEIREDLSLSQWSVLILTLWILKVYSTYYQLLLRLNISRPYRC